MGRTLDGSRGHGDLGWLLMVVYRMAVVFGAWGVVALSYHIPKEKG